MNQEYIDLLIKGGVLLSSENVMKDHGIAIKNDIIKDVDSIRNLKKKYKPNNIINASNKIIMPGMVDGHVHNAQIMLRGSIEDNLIAMPPIWLNYLIPFEKLLTEDQVKISSLFSMLNLIKSGVTTFIEAGGPHPNKIAEATLDSGLRGIITKSTIDTDPEIPMYQETDEIIDEYEDLIKTWNGIEDRIQVWPSLREIMLNSLDLYDRLFDLAEKFDTSVSMHLAESRTEVDYTLEKFGKRPVELVYDEGYLNKRTLAAHMIFVNDREMGMVEDSGNSSVWCPTVDAMVMGHSRANEMLERGIPVMLGSDGGEWNNLDLLEQARQARISSKLHSNSLYHEKTSLNTFKTFNMLTNNSEKILRKPIGKLKKNYKADIIILDPKTNLIPNYNKKNTVINMANSNNIEGSIINGKIVMENNKLKTLNEQKIIENTKKLAKNLKENIKNLKEDFNLKEN